VEQLEDRWCPSYTITDLGTLGGAASTANAINGAGQVVGAAQVKSGSYHPFLYSAGVMTDLGVAAGFTDGAARAINSSGQVAVSEGVGGNVNGDAFLWQSSSGLADLGNLGGSPTVPLGINNATTVQVVGTGTPVGGGGHAWLWQGSTGMIDLNTKLPANSGWVLTEADGINDNQQIVGQGIINGQYHAFLWQFGSGVLSAPTDLGNLPGGTNSGAKAINSTGQVAGWSTTSLAPSGYHAFLWTSPGPMNDLGTLPNETSSHAYALNNAGQVQVVGSSDGSAGNLYGVRATLWQNSTVIDLNSQLPKKSGWSLLENAYGINDAGQIVGQGSLTSGASHAFLLTPISTKKAPALASTDPMAAVASAAAPVVDQRASALGLDPPAFGLLSTGQTAMPAAPLPRLVNPSASAANQSGGLSAPGTSSPKTAKATDAVFAVSHQAANDNGAWLFAPLSSRSPDRL
jgi:probable HAF family extracellular repeat protein